MKYYLNTNGQQGGPFELSELLINGLTPQSYVWNETMTNWAPAMQVPEVAAFSSSNNQHHLHSTSSPLFHHNQKLHNSHNTVTNNHSTAISNHSSHNMAISLSQSRWTSAKQSKCASISLPTLKAALAARNFGGSNFSPTSFPL